MINGNSSSVINSMSSYVHVKGYVQLWPKHVFSKRFKHWWTGEASGIDADYKTRILQLGLRASFNLVRL